ncbi:hypothetical protein TNCV_1295711 [Trichonephila clavipes]|uniref:Uncharacterized protein n=1 Tax=Trichonephila clavipes TaxID=2585209 RepID=A0A8X6VNY8_TRICX|nr:hypothetical protein TNCV_1295711 [Trichonephila clavipes]
MQPFVAIRGGRKDGCGRVDSRATFPRFAETGIPTTPMRFTGQRFPTPTSRLVPAFIHFLSRACHSPAIYTHRDGFHFSIVGV